MNNNLISGINIATIAKNLNKTLSIINKAIPLYNKVKPMINSESFNSILNILNQKPNVVKKSQKVDTIKKVSNNLPTFFQ